MGCPFEIPKRLLAVRYDASPQSCPDSAPAAELAVACDAGLWTSADTAAPAVAAAAAAAFATGAAAVVGAADTVEGAAGTDYTAVVRMDHTSAHALVVERSHPVLQQIHWGRPLLACFCSPLQKGSGLDPVQMWAAEEKENCRSGPQESWLQKHKVSLSNILDATEQCILHINSH